MIVGLQISAFYVGDATAAVLQQLQQDKRMIRSKVAVQPGGIQGAVEYLAGGAPVQLLIVEATETGDSLFAALEALAENCNPETKVVLLGQENDIALYKELMGMGLGDYVSGAVTSEQLVEIAERSFSASATASLGRVVACIGARGGVGSSTVAVNTAYCLGQQFNENVVLVDLDLAFGTAALALDLQPDQDVSDALVQAGELDVEKLHDFLVRYDDHLWLVPAAPQLNGAAEISPDSFEALITVISQMASFVVLDLPHQWTPWVHQALVVADEVVVTAYPDLANLRDVKNLFDSLSSNRGEELPVRLVFNGVGRSKKSELPLAEFTKPLDVTPAATIRFNPALFGGAMNEGQTIAQASKKDAAVKEFDTLAKMVSDRQSDEGRKSVFSFLGRNK